MNDTPADCLAVLGSADDVDELYSNLLYMPPVVVHTPDGRRWEVFVTFDDETRQIHHLDVPCRDGWQHEPVGFKEADGCLRGGIVLPRTCTAAS